MAVGTAANSDTFTLTTPSEREIRLTRMFDAPAPLLFEAMTRPEHITRWWGCLAEGYSVPECEVDLRPGGAWRFVNRTPKGDLAVFYGVYREIAPPTRLVYTEVFEPYPDTESLVTAEFVEEGRKTRLIVTSVYPSKEVRDAVLQTGMEYGAAISYDRLEDLGQELQR